MNTAARMEHNGERGKIQVSQETADLLIAAGKSHWIRAREDKIIAKGKGTRPYGTVANFFYLPFNILVSLVTNRGAQHLLARFYD
jgi:hypothetical protein